MDSTKLLRLAKCLLKYYNQYSFIRKHSLCRLLRRRPNGSKRGSLAVKEKVFGCLLLNEDAWNHTGNKSAKSTNPIEHILGTYSAVWSYEYDLLEAAQCRRVLLRNLRIAGLTSRSIASCYRLAPVWAHRAPNYSCARNDVRCLRISHILRIHNETYYQ